MEANRFIVDKTIPPEFVHILLNMLVMLDFVINIKSG